MNADRRCRHAQLMRTVAELAVTADQATIFKVING